jgi:SAM-dependent methyltransferase
MAAPAEPLIRPDVRSEATLGGDRSIALPEVEASHGDLEYCLVEDEDGWRQIRVRNDPRFWQLPGAYNHLVRTLLRGNAPAAITRLLERDLLAAGETPSNLRVLNLDAGNGWVAHELQTIGIRPVIGVDRSEDAAAAASRENAEAFSDYRVIDMRRLSESQRDQLMSFDLSCLIRIDPLALNDPAPNAFTEAFNLLAPEGWIAFHLEEEAWSETSNSRFARLLRQMIAMGSVEICTEERYRHRFTTQGKPLFHIGFIARKQRDFDPAEA